MRAFEYPLNFEVQLSDMDLCEDLERLTKTQRPEKHLRPDSPTSGPSCVSIASMGVPLGFKDTTESQPEKQLRPDSTTSGPSCVSIASIGVPLGFKDTTESQPEQQPRPDSPTSGPSCVSIASKGIPLGFKDTTESHAQQVSEAPPVHPPTDLDSVFKLLRKDIVPFVENKLKRLQEILTNPERSERWGEDEEVLDEEEEEAFLKITLRFLKRMKQDALADSLQSRTVVSGCQRRLKSGLQKKFECVFEGIAKAGNPTLLNQMYTELYITEGGSADVNDEHEVRQIETASRKTDRPERTIRCQDIFRPSPERQRQVRTLMTSGVAGIGKTVLTQKFALDWAKDEANRDVRFTFPFTFRELNVLQGKELSLVELVHHFFPETRDAEVLGFGDHPVVFILDGLDECRHPLDFQNNQVLTDVTASVSVDTLLTNLIKGNLLPSARLWITTRPAAANQIPPQWVDMMTEVRGFTDPQKEEYFKKRFRGDQDKANRIIGHIKTSRSLHIMCHIPVFCWITSAVLEDMLETRPEGQELPKTLTEMYTHFLVVQTIKSMKFDAGAEADPHWSPKNQSMIRSLGKLAFEQLQKGRLIFYESDLTECNIDVKAASVYSGVFTEVFREERGLYQDQVFCFVHLSVQEFLAALHVHLTFMDSGVDLLSESPSSWRWWRWCLRFRQTPARLYQSAVDKALQSPNGHLDLFLRFLLGLSLETNQSVLRGLVNQERSPETGRDTVAYIKKRIGENLSPERSINLFHCLNELNDGSLVEEIQQSLSSGRMSTDELSPTQWSALGFILLLSGKNLDVFDLKKYCSSEEVLLRLLPVLKASNKAQLSGCNLSERSCRGLASVLSSKSSSLKDLDLSNNDLQDSGLQLLCNGLQSPLCGLETLRLSGCMISEAGCRCLSSALKSNPSSRLRELDLSYNHPGDARDQLLALGLQDLRMDECGERWLKPGLKKYACDLTLDTNTMNRHLKLSDGNRTVTHLREEQQYLQQPERFDFWYQVLSSQQLTGRCYWEVEWTKKVDISLAYEGIPRKGNGAESRFGGNERSWCLFCSDTDRYAVLHRDKRTELPHSSSSSNRVGVYVDRPAGTLSFYRVSSDQRIHLHTFNAAFTQPLHAGFGFWVSDTSASLCSL